MCERQRFPWVRPHFFSCESTGSSAFPLEFFSPFPSFQTHNDISKTEDCSSCENPLQKLRSRQGLPLYPFSTADPIPFFRLSPSACPSHLVLEAKEGAGCGGGHHRHEVSTSCRSTTLDGLQRPRKQIKTILRYYMWKRMEYNKITFFYI